jgi:hypothetical protein
MQGMPIYTCDRPIRCNVYYHVNISSDTIRESENTPFLADDEFGQTQAMQSSLQKYWNRSAKFEDLSLFNFI